MEQQVVNDQLYGHTSPGGGLLAFEYHLLDVSAVNSLDQGIFYMIPVKAGHNLFLR